MNDQVVQGISFGLRGPVWTPLELVFCLNDVYTVQCLDVSPNLRYLRANGRAADEWRTI